MKLLVPDEPTSLLWEGELALNEAVGPTRSADSSPSASGADVDLRDLPRVTIGTPEVWPLEDLYEKDEMPRTLRSKLDDYRFFLARFVCSFRAKSDRARLDFARFVVQLLPDTDGRQAIAHDLHPREVMRERKKNVTVALKPSISFNELQGSLGSAGFAVEYNQLDPIITVAGVGETIADWSYECIKGYPIVGSKWMHMIIRAPVGMERCDAGLDLTADVRVKGWLFSARLRREEHHRQLDVSLW